MNTAPIDATEEMNDAVRYLLVTIAVPGRTYGSVRNNCRRAGMDVENWPAWTVGRDKEHFTKSACSSLIWWLMQREANKQSNDLPRSGWHAPGLGEIHSNDHKHVIWCYSGSKNPDEDEQPDDVLANVVCSLLNQSSNLQVLAQEVQDNFSWMNSPDDSGNHNGVKHEAVSKALELSDAVLKASNV